MSSGVRIYGGGGLLSRILTVYQVFWSWNRNLFNMTFMIYKEISPECGEGVQLRSKKSITRSTTGCTVNLMVREGGKFWFMPQYVVVHFLNEFQINILFRWGCSYNAIYLLWPSRIDTVFCVNRSKELPNVELGFFMLQA